MLICEFINYVTVQLIMTILRRTEVNLYAILSKASVEVFVQQRATCTALKQGATQWCTAAWNQRVSKDSQAMKTQKWTRNFYGKPSDTALEWLQIIQIHIECIRVIWFADVNCIGPLLHYSILTFTAYPDFWQTECKQVPSSCVWAPASSARNSADISKRIFVFGDQHFIIWLP